MTIFLTLEKLEEIRKIKKKIIKEIFLNFKINH